MLLVSTGETLSAQNSTRKIRAKPSAAAARAGSAVNWREDLDSAIAEAKKTGRPVFWYVPTLRGSPMDRKPEIDRYMMAGPFSWPRVIARLNERFIPVRQVAERGGRAAKLGVVRGKFIEPGFVVLDGAGQRIGLPRSSLTTLSPDWFCATLDGFSKAGSVSVSGPALGTSEMIREGNWRGALDQLRQGPGELSSSAHRAEVGFWIGACLHRTHAGDQAREVWAAVAKQYPDEPWAWKAAAEAEGHGPFVHGFEIHRPLPEAVLEAAGRAGDSAASTSTAPAGSFSEEDARARSLDFLLGMQRADGSFADSTYDFGGTDSLPNVFAAVTALAGRAFLAELRAGIGDEARRSAVEAALLRCVRHALEEAKLAHDDSDELLWARVYRVRLLADLVAGGSPAEGLERDEMKERLRTGLAKATAAVLDLQSGRSGAFYHEYQNPFATASALSALRAAEDAGAPVDRGAVERALLALLKCRTEKGAFTYSQARGKPRASVAGAAGRMPRCELALHQWRGDRLRQVQTAVEAAFEHHQKLEAVRKYDDHASRLGYGGFFFWYDVLGRTEALAALSPSEARAAWVARQRKDILEIVELDGCFVDSHELGRCYGTAIALLAMAQLRAMD